MSRASLLPAPLPRYRPLKTDPVEVEIVGAPVDVQSLVVTLGVLQDITDRVARELLRAGGIAAPTNDSSDSRAGLSSSPSVPIVRLELRQTRTGSFWALLVFAVLEELSNPTTQAILQNLSAELIWAVATSTLKGCIAKLNPSLPGASDIAKRRSDPYRVDRFLKGILEVIKNSEGIKSVVFKSKRAGQVELRIEFFDHDDTRVRR